MTRYPTPSNTNPLLSFPFGTKNRVDEKNANSICKNASTLTFEQSFFEAGVCTVISSVQYDLFVDNVRKKYFFISYKKCLSLVASLTS